MVNFELEAALRGINAPAPATLRCYGLTAPDWLGLLAAQGWRCPVCLKDGPHVRWNTDHEHVPGWKGMPSEERRRHVRGVLCAYCNHRRVNSRMPADEALRIAGYLAAYEARRDETHGEDKERPQGQRRGRGGRGATHQARPRRQRGGVARGAGQARRGPVPPR